MTTIRINGPLPYPDGPFPYAEGVTAGIEGQEVRDNPYHRSTRDGYAWERGRQWGVHWRDALTKRSSPEA